jgi:phosphate starvation-inducible PhoH-like protein
MFYSITFVSLALLVGVNFCSNAYVCKRHLMLYMKKDKQPNLNIMYKAKGENQRLYTQYLEDNNNNIIVAVGPAGTGKTMLACMKAITLLKTGDLHKIIITRPAVTVEEDIGFLPGNIVKKMDPWTRPIFDMFLEFFSKTELDNMIHNGVIEVSPLAYMRGRTFKNAFIIADEMQNSSPNQMMMLTTRIGVNSRIVITGDLKQSDRLKDNGLLDFMNKAKLFYKYYNTTNETNCVKIVEFTNLDVERSEIVKKVIDIYNYKKEAEPIKMVTQSVKETNYIKNIKSNNENTTKYYIPENDAALIPIQHSAKFKKIWE